MVLSADDGGDGPGLFDALAGFGPVLAVKLYRLPRAANPDLPTIPCLDHEAMLHEGIDPHAAAYVQESSSGDLHEVVWTPGASRVEIDTVSTWGEHSPESRARLEALLRERLPTYRVNVLGPSWWRGERRAAKACLAQISLRDVLLGHDMAAVAASIARLQTISALMEKQSRVASWGMRTVTGPLLAAAGAATYLVMEAAAAFVGEAAAAVIRYTAIGMLGGIFLYYGVKAVQLTEMSNRVWKRTAEYGLILAERQRLRARAVTRGGAP